MTSAAFRSGIRRLPAEELLGVLGLAAAGAIWLMVAAAVGSDVLLPPPQDVAKRLFESFLAAGGLAEYGLPESLWGNLVYTVENVLISVTLGTALGAVIGWVSARSLVARAIVSPILATVGTVPLLIAIPFFVIWFGIDRGSGIMFVTLYTSLIVVLFTQRAADNLDPVYEDAARTLGAGRRALLWHVIIPGTVPGILGGIRIAAAGAWGLQVVAEFLFLPLGLGKVILIWNARLDVEGILAAILLLALVAVLFDSIIVALGRRVSRWTPRRA